MAFFTSDEKAAERLEICRACDRFLALTQQCKVCMCFMPAKVRLPREQCPIEKWGPVEGTDNVC